MSRRLWVMGTVSALVVIGCAGGMSALISDAPPPPAVETPTQAANNPSAAPKAKPSAPAKPAPKPTQFGEGEWEVGTEIPAGTYRTSGTKDGIIDFCIWSVAPEDGADPIDFGSSSTPTESGRVKLKNGQIFETSGCKIWEKIK